MEAFTCASSTEASPSPPSLATWTWNLHTRLAALASSPSRAPAAAAASWHRVRVRHVVHYFVCTQDARCGESATRVRAYERTQLSQRHSRAEQCFVAAAGANQLCRRAHRQRCCYAAQLSQVRLACILLDGCLLCLLERRFCCLCSTSTQLSQVRLEALCRSTDFSLRSRTAQHRLLIALISLSSPLYAQLHVSCVFLFFSQTMSFKCVKCSVLNTHSMYEARVNHPLHSCLSFPFLCEIRASILQNSRLGTVYKSYPRSIIVF